MNDNNLAILTSIKGMNPLTGRRINGLGLEQYIEKCPIHDIAFLHDKFCSECNFKWPDQNYITDPDLYYLDGFRSSDGIVRQFYFTEDMTKSVPELIIGKEDTVPAFGFCFYNLKEKPIVEYENGKRYKNKFPKNNYNKNFTNLSYKDPYSHNFYIHPIFGYGGGGTTNRLFNLNSNSNLDDSALDINYMSSASSKIQCNNLTSNLEIPTASGPISIETINDNKLHEQNRLLKNTEVGIGAGEKIQQQFTKDSKLVNKWNEKPAAIIKIYFVFREQFERMVDEGLNDLSGYNESFLQGVPVGGKNE